LGKDLDLKIIYPVKSLVSTSPDEINNTSITSQLVFGSQKIMLTGDLQVAGEADLIKSHQNLQSDILKVGHHGSDTASDEDFLKSVAPKDAVIEVGKNNKYGLPDGRIIKRLERLGSKIFRTDVNGTIKVRSDGQVSEFVD
jgi:competence protein ComEC